MKHIVKYISNLSEWYDVNVICIVHLIGSIASVVKNRRAGSKLLRVKRYRLGVIYRRFVKRVKHDIVRCLSIYC